MDYIQKNGELLNNDGNLIKKKNDAKISRILNTTL